MEAVQDGYAGLHRKDQLQGDTVGEESGHNQPLSSHPGPADREELSQEDES